MRREGTEQILPGAISQADLPSFTMYVDSTARLHAYYGSAKNAAAYLGAFILFLKEPGITEPLKSGLLPRALARKIKAMSKLKKPVPAQTQPALATELHQALTKAKKSELVDVLIELAQADRGVHRQLTDRFKVETASDNLVAETHQAIVDATDFDEREMSSNFDYDFEAYAVVKRNLGCLIASGQLRQAQQLALELMDCGSCQVEMSDEGLMTDDIEECLSELIKSVTKCDQSKEEVLAWCTAMLDADRTGSIARESLEALRRRVSAAKAK